MNKLLTISIAAYNVEKYIRQTLESLCVESVISYLEVFVVDDGGIDNSLSIAKEYAKKYPGSIIPVHKENGGWGSTVNYSIEHASGKYFKLLDGDDYFSQNGLIDLINTLKLVDEDVIYTPYRRFDDLSGKTVEVFSASSDCPKNRTISVVDILDKVDFVMHSSTFKTELLQKNMVRVLEHCFYTDNEYRTKAMAFAKTAYVLDAVVYEYRVGREGQSVDLVGLKKHYLDNLKVFKSLYDFTENTNSICNSHIALKYTKSVANFHYDVLVRLGLKKEIMEFDSFLFECGSKYYNTDNRMIKSLRNRKFENLAFYTKYLRLRSSFASKIKILINR